MYLLPGEQQAPSSSRARTALVSSPSPKHQSAGTPESARLARGCAGGGLGSAKSSLPQLRSLSEAGAGTSR